MRVAAVSRNTRTHSTTTLASQPRPTKLAAYFDAGSGGAPPPSGISNSYPPRLHLKMTLPEGTRLGIKRKVISTQPLVVRVVLSTRGTAASKKTVEVDRVVAIPFPGYQVTMDLDVRFGKPTGPKLLKQGLMTPPPAPIAPGPAR